MHPDPQLFNPEACSLKLAAWRVIVEHDRSARDQMACDVALAEEAQPTLRFFTWAPPAVSLGWKQRAPEWLSCAEGVDVVERPTGGGAAFHGSDVSVAVIVPRALALPLEVLMRSVCHSAARLCDWYGAEVTCVLEARAEGRITYCLSQPSPYAILSGSRKLAGFALRRYPNSWLIQGSLLIRPIPAPLVRNIPDAVGQQLRMRAISLSEATHTVLDERTVAAQWAQQWSSWWEERWLEESEVPSGSPHLFVGRKPTNHLHPIHDGLLEAGRNR